MAASTAEPYALGSAASEKTIRLALWGACHGANRNWHDDMLQAARLKLWRMGKRWPMVWQYGGAHYRAALNAMRDEYGRLQAQRGHGAEVLDSESQDDVWSHRSLPCGDLPDSHLQALQDLRVMEAAAPGWPAALLLHSELAAAGAAMGVSESRACQIRVRLRAALQDAHAPKAHRRQQHGRTGHARTQENHAGRRAVAP